MANKFNGFLDNVAGSILNPKGNLGDFAHAARLYTDNNHALAPKTKFLYHVFLDINPVAASIIPSITAQKINEMGMLVKSADLPKFTAAVETKKMYNRVKNIQTAIEYEPVNITFHDDNSSLTTALMQAYYRYYFADGNQRRNSGRAYNRDVDSTYEGADRNQYKFGLDNNQQKPFFNSIKISQLSRGGYVTYTLVNPIVTTWGHDSLSNQDGGGTTENTMQIAYEAVFYDAGKIETGAQGEPTGFGQDHYDNTPSPISILGGGATSIGSIIEGALDLYDWIAGGDSFDNPLEAALAAANLIGNVRNLSSEGLRQGGLNILTTAIGNVAGVNVNGVANTLFPKGRGDGGSSKLLLATAGAAVAVNAINNFRSRQQLESNPAALNSAAKQQFAKSFQSQGNAGGVNEITSFWNALPESEKQTYREQALDNV